MTTKDKVNAVMQAIDENPRLDYEIGLALDVMERIITDLTTLSKEGFMMFLGAIVDQYGAEKGLDSAETCAMIDELATVQKEVHEAEGPAIAWALYKETEA